MTLDWFVRVGGFCMAILLSAPALPETAFDRAMKAWDQANPEPKGRSQIPGQFEAQKAATARACANEKARLEATYGGGNTLAYNAAFDAHADCTHKAALDWLWQNDAGYREHKQWSDRRQQAVDDAIDGKLTPAPNVSAQSPGAPVPPLRPTVAQEAHNPAGEASDCVRVIYSDDFEVEHVSTTQKAAFRNRCSRPVEISWCTATDDCRPGYTNLATVPAKNDRGFSYEPSVAGSKVAYAACYNGFVQHQGELSKKLLHACK